MDQPGKVANPARGQLNREIIVPCPRACLIIWSRETGSAVPSRVSLLISVLRLKQYYSLIGELLYSTTESTTTISLD